MLAAALALAKFVPDILGLFAGPKAEAVAGKVVDIAQAVTGQASPDAALKAIQSNPQLALKFKQAVLDQQVELARIAAQREKDAAEADNEADRVLTERIAQLEGTAQEWKGVPIVGPAMLFLRGAQRIVIGYGVAWVDYLWLTGGLGTLNTMQERALFTATLLVFTVMFGERAIRNVAPLVAQILEARGGGK